MTYFLTTFGALHANGSNHKLFINATALTTGQSTPFLDSISSNPICMGGTVGYLRRIVRTEPKTGHAKLESRDRSKEALSIQQQSRNTLYSFRFADQQIIHRIRAGTARHQSDETDEIQQISLIPWLAELRPAIDNGLKFDGAESIGPMYRDGRHD